MGFKKEMVVYADIGLFGTFVRWVYKASEKNYRWLEYVPLNSFPPKKVLLDKAIHDDHIHRIDSPHQYPGVEKSCIFIFTGETGSIIKNVLDSDNQEIIRDLRDKLKKLKIQVTTSKQSEEDARSGVAKAISSMKNTVKSQHDYPSTSYYPSGFPPNSNNNEYNEFQNF